MIPFVTSGGSGFSDAISEIQSIQPDATVLVVLVLFCVAGSIFSDVMLSRHIFSFLPFGKGLSFARKLHMLSAYWGFVFMSLHFGFHWNMMMGMAKQLTKNSSVIRTWAIRIIALIIAGYGAAELICIFDGHIADGTIALCDGLRSYHVFPGIADCTVKDCNNQKWKNLVSAI